MTKKIIEWGGIVIILGLTYAETGLLLGLLIPGGETLLFTAGVLISTQTLPISILLFLTLILTSALLGDLSGYLIGKKLGPKLYEKKDTWYFKKKYLHMTEDYYKKNKKKAILAGKFLPVIRPFNPVIAGATGIPLKKFGFYSFIATLLYTTTFTLLGYFLGTQFPQIKKYLGWIIPISIVIALTLVFLQYRKQRKEISD